MSREKNKEIMAEGQDDLMEFSLEIPSIGSSGGSSPIKARTMRADLGLDVETFKPDSLPADPLFRMLADPKLPHLEKRDRAKLQLQSPNRIHFYWSVRSNPYKTLAKALGGTTGSYALIARLRNLSNGTEEFVPVESRGNWWFDVDADSLYQCEIGFYAPNRPYIRIAYSNELRTPRKTPSLRTDYTPSFTATADEFAQALDAAGYKKDAFDITLAGDDPHTARSATHKTYQELSGTQIKRGAFSDGDLRFVLFALAAGYSLEELRAHIDPSLFAAVKKDLEGISSRMALKALEANFDIVTDEIEVFEEVGSKVFGASAVNFPRRMKIKRMPRSLVPKFDELTRPGPISSPTRP